jgi:predicted RNase H-like HicB family nuclease
MGTEYQVQVNIGRQEDGLWRVEVPDLHGCWVDAPTLAQTLSEIQEIIAMVISYANEQGWPLPSSVTPLTTEPGVAQLPIILSEHGLADKGSRSRRAKSLPV